MVSLRDTVRPFVPRAVRNWRRDRVRKRDAAANAGRTTREIFEAVYGENKWGGDSLTEGSGSGSDVAVGRAYIDYVNAFLANHPDVKTVADIGCGDFRIASQFKLQPGQRYLGLDVVRPLIETHQAQHASPQVFFACVDAVSEPVPHADLYLVRQVLQHLSNAAVATVLNKIAPARYALISEHHPAPAVFTGANRDKPTGPDVRVFDGSGIDLTAPPFALSHAKIVLTSHPAKPLVAEGETIVTYLVTRPD